MKGLILEKKLRLISLFVNILVALYFLQPLLLTASNPEYILFVEKDCDFCTITSQEISEKNYQQRLQITFMDISESKFYEDLYISITARCSLEANQKGVPLLYSEQKCYVGAKNTLQELERLSVVN